jgi:hypothetical protein
LFKKPVLALFFLFGFSALSAEAARLDIIISKSTQKMTVMVDGEVEYVWPVSTGAAGYDTPSGKFKAFRLEEDHESKEWDNAPMPHSVFFTTRGHAIHGSYSKRIGQRASHGCVRLNPDNAETLFYMVEENGLGNTHVTVKGGFFDFAGDSTPVFQSTKPRTPTANRLFGSRPNPVGVLKRKLAKTEAGIRRRGPSFAQIFGLDEPKPVKAKKKVSAKKVKKKPLVVSSN